MASSSAAPLRIGDPVGRGEQEVKVPDAPRLIRYEYIRGGKKFSVIGTNSTLESHMLRIAWQFFTGAHDFDNRDASKRSTKQFELYARFFIDDEEDRKIRQLPGLYAFFRDSSYMKVHSEVFWIGGHPDTARDDDALANCTLNIKTLAANVKWFVDSPTRFWNTLEFRIRDVGATHALNLYNEYSAWVSSKLPVEKIHIEPATTFDAWAQRQKNNPLFSRPEDRLDSRKWMEFADNRGRQSPAATSPSKRGSEDMDEGLYPMSIDAGSLVRLGQNAGEPPGARLRLEVVPASPLPRANVQLPGGPPPVIRIEDPNSSAVVRVGANQPPPDVVPRANVPASDVMVPVAGINGAPSRYLPVPQHGTGIGQKPTKASVLGTSLRIEDPSDATRMHKIDVQGIPNLDRNLLSVICSTDEDDNSTVTFAVLVPNSNPDQKQNGPEGVVTVWRVNLPRSPNPVLNTTTQGMTPLHASRVFTNSALDCRVSWTGLRIACNVSAQRTNYEGAKLVIIDLLNRVQSNEIAFDESLRVWSCTDTMLAMAEVFVPYQLGVNGPRAIPLKKPSDDFLDDKKLVSVSNNAWIQRTDDLKEAYAAAVFIHLYESKAEAKANNYTILVSPLDPTQTSILADGVFAYSQTYVGNGLAKLDDPRILFYSIPSYIRDAPNKKVIVDRKTDQAVVIWCVYKDHAMRTSVPNAGNRANLNSYVAMRANYALFTPTPILNDLELRVYNAKMEPVKATSFQ